MRPILVLSVLSILLSSCGGGGESSPNPAPPSPGPIADNTPPVIQLEGANPITIQVGDQYVEPGFSATDNVDGTVEVIAVGPNDYSVEGTYTITYTAKDSSNNESSVNRTLIVMAPTNSIEPIDSSKWHHQTLLPNGPSWFNGEQQHYTNRTDNSYVSDGTLKIVAKKGTFTDQGQTKQYTSARLNSKFAFQYGRVEVRAKMPTGFGTWPAIWMLGKNINERGAYFQTLGLGTTPWPQCGEVDIMEHWGRDQNYVQSAIHSPSSHGATVNKGGRYIGTTSTQFHTYTLDWNAQNMVFRVDDSIHYIYSPAVKNSATWPFDAEMFLLLNVAVEGNANFVESAMEVDYVRVYNSNNQLIWSDEFN